MPCASRGRGHVVTELRTHFNWTRNNLVLCHAALDAAFPFFILDSMGVPSQKTVRLLSALLRLGLGAESSSVDFPQQLDSDEWTRLYSLAKQQSVLGIAFAGIEKLPKESRPPMQLLMRWATEVEAIRGMNTLMNREARRLTQLFETVGRKNAILKGQANARLYPDPGLRQSGDIDIWVEGGRDSINKMLVEMGMVSEKDLEYGRFVHHAHLERSKDGIMAEVHYRPASGNPYKSRGLQDFLNREILNAELVPEGFYAPSIKFALVMQLSHLQQHFYSGGLGFRQYIDYFVLLKNSTVEVRREVSGVMKSLGMLRACSAVMWVLQQVLGLERDLMLCAPCAWRGRRLLRLALVGGNFGKYRQKPRNVFVRWFRDRRQALSWLPFDPMNAIFKELKYWRATLYLMPLRVKRRRIGL